MSYLRNAPRRGVTPQNRPLAGQVPNSAGGHAWKIEPEARLRRFLILGAETGSYYETERDLVQQNVDCLAECDPHEAIDIIATVSAQGLAPKNDPAIYALAYYATHPDDQVRRYALDHLTVICRTGTHLFHFAEFIDGNWGRAKRRAIGEWYAFRGIDDIAYQIIKYRQRDGWSHRDLLRLAHPANHVSCGNPTLGHPISAEHEHLFDWVIRGDAIKNKSALPRIVRGYRKAMKAETPKEAAAVIRKYRLPREAVNPDHLTSDHVWAALLDAGMPLGALIRNLPTLTRVGILKNLSNTVDAVVSRLRDKDELAHARIHPLQLLVAHLTYKAGHSIRGNATWEPVVQIVDALDDAFYLAFKNVEPTGKKHLIALDVSSSMDGYGGYVNGVPGLTARVASAAMSLVTMNTGDPYACVAFTARDRFHSDTAITPLNLSPKQRLADVCFSTQRLPFGRTDCALPMLFALENQLSVDAFLVYTDNETWHGNIHPSQALAQYRKASGINAKLIVVGMISNGFSIADPNDTGMMDVVGFDSSAPAIMSDFVAGKI